MKKMPAAFTMIELIFVIVVLGILAAVALPKLSSSVEDAYISKAQSHVSVIRSGLQNYRSKSLLKGNGVSYPDLNTSTLFSNVMDNGAPTGSNAGEWSYDAGTNKFIFHTGNHNIYFDYNKNRGKFTCDTTNTHPSSLCDRFE